MDCCIFPGYICSSRFERDELMIFRAHGRF
jgi:hypothetical protein